MKKGYKLLVKVIIGLFTALALVGCVSEKDADKGVRNNEQSADLQLLISDIIANDSCYSLITEVYYPEYSYNSSYYDNMSSYYYSSSYAPTSTTFDGYRYVNAYVTCFDKDGNLFHYKYMSNY